MLVKICGLTRPDDARMAIDAGADLIGFVFVPGTARAVEPASAGWIAGLEGAATVGVFRDAPLERIQTVRDALRLDWVQLHGAEPRSFIETLGPEVLRRVVPEAAMGWGEIRRLAKICLPLIDPGGGDGAAWGWEALGPAPEGLRVGVAGGLTPANVAQAVGAVHPWLVDVSSGVERTPGIKDRDRVTAFVRNARAAAID